MKEVCFEQFNKVYNMLEDKESKDIFINKVNYILTKERKYIDNIIMKYLPEFKECGIEEDLYREIKRRFPHAQIIMYGAGENARRSQMFWKDVKEFIGYCDRDLDKQFSGMYGYPVISTEKLTEINMDKDLVVVISTSKYENEAKQTLLGKGIKEERLFYLQKYLINYSNDIYFDEDIIKFEKDEIFIDAGSMNLSTSIEMKKRCNCLKKSYAFEPDSKNYNKCVEIKQEKNLDYVELLPVGLWNEKATLKFSETGGTGSSISETGNTMVKVDTLDDSISGRVSFIKMDIEGAELEALQGAENIIRKYKPKLAISIYHNPQDLTDIPLYIKNLNEEYKLYIRHYSTGEFDTVLYAV